MHTTRTVLVLSDIERERNLLKSLLNTFGRRPATHWQYIEEGIADVVVLSVDNPSLQLLQQAEKLAKVVVFYVNEADQQRLANKPYVLNKLTRGRDFLQVLEQLEDFFEAVDMPRSRVRPGYGVRTDCVAA